MKLLTIDDHALFRMGLSELLERRGIEVIDAVGESDVGLRLARDCAPDVVLMDLRMPGESGIELVRKMRREGIERRVGSVPNQIHTPLEGL